MTADNPVAGGEGGPEMIPAPMLPLMSAMPTEVYLEFVRKHYKPRTVIVTAEDGAKAEVLLLPTQSGFKVEGIDAHVDAQRERPKRRAGAATLFTLASFGDYVNRYRDAHSSLFANPDPAAPTLLCVFDHHQAERLATPERLDKDGFLDAEAGWRDSNDPKPRFGAHRAWYALPLSDEWTAWQQMDGEVMEQREFAEFLEDRIVDVLDPSRVTGTSVQDGSGGRLTLEEIKALLGGTFADPKKLMELSRGLKVAAQIAGGQVLNLSSGEIDLAYTEEHFEAGAGERRKLQVPGLFFIGVPVFKLGQRYQLPVRLRYRLAGGQVKWIYEIWRADKALEIAIAEACAEAVKATGLPLYLGSPEA